jgi:predicted Zn-dependent protease with MMP-like domain
MMRSRIESIKGIHPKYRKWTQELLAAFGPGVTYDSGQGFTKRYTFRKPVNCIRLLDESEFDKAPSMGRQFSPFLEEGYEPPFESYKALKEGESVDFSKFYKGLSRITLDTSLALWRPIFRQEGLRPTISPEYESEVLVCPSRISDRASEILDRIPELDAATIEERLFRVVLTHEIGHHFTLANYTAYDVRMILENADLNILEGLANWFTFAVLQQEERWVLAEFAIHQNISYRHYLYFKHSDISGLLDIFFSGLDYDKAPAALHKIIGGKLNLNGSTVIVETKFDGVAMDWSGKGGRIVAGEEIKALSTMSRGVFITPKIQLLIGRFPKEVTIVSNEIPNVADYKQVPDNVMILSKDSANLSEIIRKHISDDDKTRIRSILDEAMLQSVSDSL